MQYRIQRRDAVAARDFYNSLLGWDLEPSTVAMPGGVQYLEYGVGGTRWGGILSMTAEWGEMPSHWSIYVLVPDVDACATRAVEHGGTQISDVGLEAGIRAPARQATDVGRGAARPADGSRASG